MKWMDHLTQSHLDVFREGPSWLVKHRADSFAKMKASDELRFKYGLNIRLAPTQDLTTIVPTPQSGNMTINSDNRITIYKNEFPDLIETFLTWGTQDVFTHFHNAFMNNIVVLHIPKSTELEKPIEVHYELSEQPMVSSVYILAEPWSKARIVITANDDTDAATFLSQSVKVIAKEGSTVAVTCVSTTGEETTTFQRNESVCKKDAAVRWMQVCLGTIYTKTDVITHLTESGADSSTTVVFLGRGKHKHDICTESVHDAPETTSRIVTRGALNDKAKALSRGNIKITKNAPNSKGYEKQDALLLSEDAEADAIPNLEIENKDVKCNHGSTIGQLDKEELFYLMSRGLDEFDAKRTIIEGYFSPFVGSLDEKMKKKVEDAIERAVS